MKEQTRREFIKKMAYMPPAILTLVAAPAFASGGSPNGNKYGHYKNHRNYNRYRKGKRRD